MKHKIRPFIKTTGAITLLLFFVVAMGCNNTDVGHTSQALYMDCKVWGEEGRDSVTCLFQFKPGASSAAAIVLQAPATIQLDREILQPDSANFTGAYYEVQKPLSTFSGTHTIIYTNTDGSRHKEEFEFTPFILKKELPTTIKRQDIILPIEGLKPNALIRIVLIDTAFTTTDINQIDTLKNGVLLIKKQELNNVASGPVTLQLFKEEERPLKDLTKKGGQIAITYGLQRDIELRD